MYVKGGLNNACAENFAAHLYNLPETQTYPFPFYKMYLDFCFHLFSTNTAPAPYFMWCTREGLEQNHRVWKDGGTFWTMHLKIKTTHHLKGTWVWNPDRVFFPFHEYFNAPLKKNLSNIKMSDFCSVPEFSSAINTHSWVNWVSCYCVVL